MEAFLCILGTDEMKAAAHTNSCAKTSPCGNISPCYIDISETQHALEEQWRTGHYLALVMWPRWSDAWCSNHVLLRFPNLEWAVYTTIVWGGKLKARRVNRHRLMRETGRLPTLATSLWGVRFANEVSVMIATRAGIEMAARLRRREEIDEREGEDLGLHGWDNFSSGFWCNLG